MGIRLTWMLLLMGVINVFGNVKEWMEVMVDICVRKVGGLACVKHITILL